MCIVKSSTVSTNLPYNHSPVKPAPSIEAEEMTDESDSNIDGIAGLNSESVMLF